MSRLGTFWGKIRYYIKRCNLTWPILGTFCKAMKNNQCNWPRGKVLGGCSTINAMLYVRGNKKDYDLWESLGNPGWGYRHILQYFTRSEDIQISGLKNSPYHGRGIPLLCFVFYPNHYRYLINIIKIVTVPRICVPFCDFRFCTICQFPTFPVPIFLW